MARLWLGLLLSLFGPFAWGCSEPEQVLDGPDVQVASQAVVGGEVSGSFAAVGFLIVEIAGVQSYCTATLVNPQTILTAAHCVVSGTVQLDLSAQRHAAEFWIGLDVTQPAERLAIAECTPHPDYESSGIIAHDLAVCRLQQPFEDIKPIRVVTDDVTGFEDREVLVVGYGSPGESSAEAERGILRRLGMVVLAGTENTHWYYVTATSGSGVCYGDSGGPGLVEIDGEMRQVGVASYSDQDCRYTGAYNRLDAYGDWLASQGVTEESSGATVTCEVDGVCQGACLTDGDCASYMCVTGGCIPSNPTCEVAVRTVAEGECVYLNADGDICGTAALTAPRLNSNLRRCEHVDVLGNVCLTTCASCATADSCTCEPLTAGAAGKVTQ